MQKIILSKKLLLEIENRVQAKDNQEEIIKLKNPLYSNILISSKKKDMDDYSIVTELTVDNILYYLYIKI